MANLLIEATVVGLSTAIVGFIISTLLMFLTQKDFSFGKYKFWWEIVLAFFLTGFCLHLIYEALGWNKKFCSSR